MSSKVIGVGGSIGWLSLLLTIV
ncbi:GlyGly-CTERM sorting domain-containing protein [Methylobacterium soli]|uniref:GlyGly-CTERM sorting domain-containing protein n=1 Tax=Methylobacterium soli TaxID=553447 RepID=A0A6L3SR38_9HYPH|nr:GlyGly-CTERM sorting domain-containing protein [Methylobacterium soli]